MKVENGRLVPTFGNLRLSLTHRHFDVFDLEWREQSEEFHIFPLTFLTAPEGDVMALTVPFESTLDPIRFDRQPDPRTRDPQVLRSLAGTYSLGPIDIVIRLVADTKLTASTPGNPSAELIPGRGLRFSVKGQPTLTLEFVLREDGAVEKLILQPLGVLTPKK